MSERVKGGSAISASGARRCALGTVIASRVEHVSDDLFIDTLVGFDDHLRTAMLWQKL
jgi:hypothetical protein